MPCRMCGLVRPGMMEGCTPHAVRVALRRNPTNKGKAHRLRDPATWWRRLLGSGMPRAAQKGSVEEPKSRVVSQMRA
jgi:hypothetical protein